MIPVPGVGGSPLQNSLNSAKLYRRIMVFDCLTFKRGEWKYNSKRERFSDEIHENLMAFSSTRRFTGEWHGGHYIGK